MNTLLPVAIDGSDTFRGIDPRIDALEAFYRAFNQRDAGAMARHWSHAPEVAMSNPLGGICRGWPAIHAVYERIFGGPARVHVVFHDYSLHGTDELYYAVGRERGTLERGTTRLELAIRTTRLFRRIDGAWRQVHHHGSFEDPALFEAYREALA
jgi:ketosteroid isomerase-like protein